MWTYYRGGFGNITPVVYIYNSNWSTPSVDTLRQFTWRTQVHSPLSALAPVQGEKHSVENITWIYLTVFSEKIMIKIYKIKWGPYIEKKILFIHSSIRMFYLSRIFWYFFFFNTTQWTITKEFYFSTKVLFFNNTHLTFANWKNSSRYFPKAFSSSLFQTLHGHCKHRKCRHSIYLYTNHLFKTPRRLSYLQRYITIFIRLYYNCLASHNC